MRSPSAPGSYDVLFERVLSRVDPERAHRGAFAAIRVAGRTPLLGVVGGPTSPPVRVMGLDFPGRLGLAAGFDKNAEGVRALAALGFGSVEVGTVTAWPQPGNPRPRLFRLPADRAVLNRMGFNNDGAAAVAARLRRLRRRPVPCPVGVNIGKTKVVPEDDVAAVLEDYTTSTRLLAPYADYLVVNVSSPNTPGLRSLQAVGRLGPLLARVRREADLAVPGRPVPLLVKIAPDLADEDVLGVCDLVRETGADGVVATNTTLDRGGLRTPADQVAALGAGGISGAPLRGRAQEVTRLVREHVGDRLVVVAAGGIGTVQDARDRAAAGADLLQAYTGFIYGGPRWPRRINGALADRPSGAAA